MGLREASESGSHHGGTEVCPPPQHFLAAASSKRLPNERFLSASRRLRVRAPDDRFGELRQGYAWYNVELRGLSASSCYQHAHTVADFLARGLRTGQPLSSLSRVEVERYILLRSKELSRHSLQHTVAHLRAFLRYAHDMGHLPLRLDALDTPRAYRGELPPRAVPWSTVQSADRVDRSAEQGRLARLLHPALDRPLRVAALRGRRPSPGLDRLGHRGPARLPAQDLDGACPAARAADPEGPAKLSAPRPPAARRYVIPSCSCAPAAPTARSSATRSATSLRSAPGKRGCLGSAITSTACGTRSRCAC